MDILIYILSITGSVSLFWLLIWCKCKKKSPKNDVTDAELP